MSDLAAGSAHEGSAESTRAALQCLIEVARPLGVHLTHDQLIHQNQIAPTTEVGPKQLLHYAKRAGLKGKQANLSWRHLEVLQRKLPLIIYLKNGNPVIIKEIHSTEQLERVILQDPTTTEDAPLILDRLMFEKVWAGEALLIKRDFSVRDEEQPFGMRFVSGLLLQERSLLRDILICAVFLSVLTLTPILSFRLLGDRVLSHQALSTFAVISIALALSAIFDVAFSCVRRALLAHLSSRVDAKLSSFIFDKIVRLPIEIFESHSAGHIARNLGEALKIKDFFMKSILGSALDTIIVFFIIPMMFLVSPLLTFMVLGCCAAIAIWIAAMLPAMGRRTRATIAAEVAKNSFFIQSIQGMRTIKSLALEPRQVHQFEVLSARSIVARHKEANFANILISGIMPIEKFMLSGVFAIGIYIAMTTKDAGAAAEIFTFLLLAQRVAGPLTGLAHLIEAYQEVKGSTQMVADMINVPTEDALRGRGVRSQIDGKVEFSSVRFSYRGASSPALDEVTFEIPKGTTIGIMGRSGSGKTTVTRLLQRLHSSYEGLIKVDGIDIREYALDHLRGNLGVVLQESFLFSGSIRENITAAKVDATFDEVVRAARLAGAEEFIDRLPRGYETQINEGSTNFSGGQRQRIAIARALITNPKILILDEATSALDPDSEAIVNANLKKISEGRTVIVISHRLTSLVGSDAILVLERGRVHDIGKHAELMNRCDIYRDLWNQQNGQISDRPTGNLRLVR